MPIAVPPKRSLTSSSALKADAKATAKPLYASQSTLPHLPVPTLSSTFHKYLETLRPLLSDDAYARNEKLVKSFLSSDYSKTLQSRLEARAGSKESWLSEWWNETAYMGYRGRIIPDVSYFYVHKRGLGKGQSQEDRAAELVRATVEFKKLVDSELLEPEKVKGQPLCMESYKYLFNAVRVPTSPADVPTAFGQDNHHIVVVRNNRYFKVDTKGRGKAELAQAFKEIKKIADSKEGSGVGILTVDNRDLWTETRNHLISLSPANKATIQAIDSAILLVCLDAEPAPSTEDARAWSLWAGGHDRSAKGKGFNRWFDKHQIIVDSAGETGFNGEHSMLDGTPTLRLNEFTLGSIQAGKIPLELPEGEKADTPMPKPEELVFELDGKTKDVIEQSKKGFGEDMSLQDLKMVHFQGYGKNAIKTHRASPDAWVQMVKQLAFYRLFGRPGITYESCQTRKYLLGRTEVIRSASNESKAFCEAMLNSQSSDLEREKKFRAAVGRHIQYSVWAADGQGVDRHMFGLKKLVDTSKGESVPEVFTDKDGLRSGHWELSTSQLSSKFLDGWGYGEVVEDGYGLSYSIDDDAIRWCITTKNNDAAKFGEALCAAAEELRAVMDRAKAAGEKAEKAKV
ncbi:carnitine O-acetyltransferase [Kwoniella heveanensis CBS 569]|uniref:Carnitine O-acetyltransferase, mitochondrial n=1 Tax=Kwoniella heveanensis BCC8398 TaxID=1296120 RepID=A0A1B9GU77_9TREE|nr:carnitine O-acetyltransferase [Kwoniella heveanensis BCC8398]OCF45006.1 carnitine O-acetyltransferase [Kwoniella heveanensis CBS 569]